jgi:TolB-like protein
VALLVEEGWWLFLPYHQRGHFQFGRFTTLKYFASGLALPSGPAVAVLPFENLSEDPKQEYFSDGLTEDIITALSRFKDLFVIARNSTFRYKGQAVDVRQLNKELGARYVLEGSVPPRAS